MTFWAHVSNCFRFVTRYSSLAHITAADYASWKSRFGQLSNSVQSLTVVQAIVPYDQSLITNVSQWPLINHPCFTLTNHWSPLFARLIAVHHCVAMTNHWYHSFATTNHWSPLFHDNESLITVVPQWLINYHHFFRNDQSLITILPRWPTTDHPFAMTNHS